MKPFYGIDRTENKKNTCHEGDCFIAASVSGMAGDALTRAAEQTVAAQKRASLPVPLGIVHKGAGLIAALLFFGIIRGLRNVTLLQAYENAPGLFWTLLGCAGAWLVLTAVGGVIRKKAESTEEFAAAVRRMEQGVEAAFRELGVPQNAKAVDVICIRHRWKNGKMKPVANGMEISEYISEPFQTYVQGGKLCLANVEHRYEFDLREIKCLRNVKKHLYSQGWNKDESFREGFYKPYKLTADNYGRIHMKRYGILELEHAGESWGIWLPPYELNYIAALTGLNITE